MAIKVVKPGQSRVRHTRTPNFPVYGGLRPYSLGIMWAHPVLPGETLTNYTFKGRVMSAPTKNPLIGSWYEQFLFYVKLSDINPDYRDFFVPELSDPSVPVSASDRAELFQYIGDVEWIRQAYLKVHSEYFLDVDEPTGEAIGGGLGSAYRIKAQNMNWANNLQLSFTEDTTGAGVEAEAGQSFGAAEMYRLMMMEEQDFEDYLRQYGVSLEAEDRGVPELLRYARSWTLPRNSVDTDTGIPAAMWDWRLDLNAKKDKFFKEPGLLLACHAVRPKVYMNHCRPMLGRFDAPAKDWLPPYTIEDPMQHARRMNLSDLPLNGASVRTDTPADVEAILDFSDVFTHGEQFINPATAQYAPYTIAPRWNDADSDQERRGLYPTTAEVDAMFTGSTAATRTLTYDGLAMVEIRGHVMDQIR